MKSIRLPAKQSFPVQILSFHPSSTQLPPKIKTKEKKCLVFLSRKRVLDRFLMVTGERKIGLVAACLSSL